MPRKNHRAKKRTYFRSLQAAIQSSAYSPPRYSEPITIPLTWLKFIIALFLLPICYLVTCAFFECFTEATVESQFWRTEAFWFFALGFVLWIILFLGLKRPFLFLYVLGHELTHVLFVFLCGGKVSLREFRVSKQGGQVIANKNNVLISLSLYFFPFYTLISVGLLSLCQYFFTVPHYDRLLFLCIGMTWSFHLTFTVWIIAKNQPDLKENGTFFSLTFIYLINLLIISAFLLIGSRTATWKSFVSSLLNSTNELLSFLRETFTHFVHFF